MYIQNVYSNQNSLPEVDHNIFYFIFLFFYFFLNIRDKKTYMIIVHIFCLFALFK